jgi:DNA helicase-2/ATP-dependent DNA helicase PcrA
MFSQIKEFMEKLLEKLPEDEQAKVDHQIYYDTYKNSIEYMLSVNGTSPHFWMYYDPAKGAKAEWGAVECWIKKDGTMDYDDMIFIPVRNKWVTARFDLIVIDEAQDMNYLQLLFLQKLRKKGGRIFVVGDDRQAIYGFRGADSNSISRLQKELKATGLSLNTTYRCAQKVVEYAQTIVPDINAAPSNGTGSIREIEFHKIMKEARVGDFVLSRTNAPLTKACLQLIRGGIRAKIEGKDIGKTLLNLTKKIAHGTGDIDVFIERITTWEEAQTRRLMATKKKSAEKKVDFVRDQAEMLRAIAEDSTSMIDFETRLYDLFADTGGKGDYVICSSVHKAKGLESKNVFILRDTLYPGGQRANPEEANIEYVAVTRAKENLIWVNGLD